MFTLKLSGEDRLAAGKPLPSTFTVVPLRLESVSRMMERVLMLIAVASEVRPVSVAENFADQFLHIASLFCVIF